MKTCCIVVIGHVDHGKTSLVRALTGIATDRLPEEKARGLSITPGFAHCSYPGGMIDFVDAPGHADFIQGMISGATGAQAALVVISMADGIGAQTLEHLCIAGLLGISRALIAVTKSDLVPLSDQAERLTDISESLSHTPFAKAPLVVCSAVSGAGIEKLHEELEKVLGHPPSHPDALHSFLPIDRAFTLPGRGTIVTGTLLGRGLATETKLVLQPAGREVSIRGLQSRGIARDRIQVGERMAANLRGVAASDISRGAVLCAPGTSTPSAVIDAHLDLLPAHCKGLKHMQELRVVFGTSSAVAQVRLFKNQDGGSKFAQLRFQTPIVCFAGQMAILRRLSPPETIGGAVFVDPLANPTGSGDARRLQVLKAAQKREPKAIAKALCAAGGGAAKLSDIARLARLVPDETVRALGEGFPALNIDLMSSAEDVKAARTATLDALAAYHLRHPIHMMAPRVTIEDPRFAPPLLQHVEDSLLADGHMRRDANMLSLRDHDPVALLNRDQRKSMANLEDLYRQAGLTTPSPIDLSQSDQFADLIQLLIDTGSLIALRNIALNQTLTLHVDTVTAAATALAAVFPASQPFTTSQARTALGTSRRIIVPLLEHFDSLGVTIRDQDTRRIADLNSVSQTNPP